MHERRYPPAYFQVFLVPGIGIIVATVYIYAHYAIDVLLGLLVAVVLFIIMEKWGPGRRQAATSAAYVVKSDMP